MISQPKFMFKNEPIIGSVFDVMEAKRIFETRS